MKAKHLLPLLTVFTLVGCNKNLKTITDEQALELTKAMYTRQTDTSAHLFDTPKTLTLKYSNKYVRKYKEASGELSETEEESIITAVDVNNLKSSIKTNYKDNTYSSQDEVITFYNSSDSKLYILTNQNGYKTKIVKSGTAKDAKLLFEEFIEATYYKNNSYLSSFSTTLEEYKANNKKYEGQTDQYYKYSFGSSDAKSFQVILDEKYKRVTTGDIEFSGYETIKTNTIMKEDKMYSYSRVDKNDSKANKASFYYNTEETTNEEYSYDSVSISVPDVSEYETTEI